MYLGLLVFSTILGLNEKKKKKTVFMQVSLLSHSQPFATSTAPPPFLRRYLKSFIKEEWLTFTLEALTEVEKKGAA